MQLLNIAQVRNGYVVMPTDEDLVGALSNCLVFGTFKALVEWLAQNFEEKA